jgi:predicted nucleic acid-binding protein
MATVLEPVADLQHAAREQRERHDDDPCDYDDASALVA